MKIFCRLVIITGKLLRLCGLFVLIRCFGIDGAGYLVAGLKAICDRCRVAGRILVVHAFH